MNSKLVSYACTVNANSLYLQPASDLLQRSASFTFVAFSCSSFPRTWIIQSSCKFNYKWIYGIHLQSKHYVQFTCIVYTICSTVPSEVGRAPGDVSVLMPRTHEYLLHSRFN